MLGHLLIFLSQDRAGGCTSRQYIESEHLQEHANCIDCSEVAFLHHFVRLVMKLGRTLCRTRQANCQHSADWHSSAAVAAAPGRSSVDASAVFNGSVTKQDHCLSSRKLELEAWVYKFHKSYILHRDGCVASRRSVHKMNVQDMHIGDEEWRTSDI